MRYSCERCTVTWSDGRGYSNNYQTEDKNHDDPLVCVGHLREALARERGYMNALDGEVRFHRELVEKQLLQPRVEP